MSLNAKNLSYEQGRLLQVLVDASDPIEASELCRQVECSWAEMYALGDAQLIDLGLSRIAPAQLHPTITNAGRIAAAEFTALMARSEAEQQPFGPVEQAEFQTVWELTPEQRVLYDEALQLLTRANKILGEAKIPHIIATSAGRRVSPDGRRGREAINCGCFAPMTESDPSYSKVIAEMEKAYLINGGHMAQVMARRELEQPGG